MTRLTKALREKMVIKAIETAGITEGFAGLTSRRAKLAEDVRVFSLGGTENVARIEKAVAKIKKMQSSDELKVVNRTNFYCSINASLRYCNLAGAQVHLYFNGQHNTMGNIESVFKDVTPQSVTLTADNPLVSEFHKLSKERDGLISRRDGLKAQVDATLAQFTTVKKLLDQWPEAKDLLPTNLEESKPLLPVVQVKDLNCLIGLPK